MLGVTLIGICGVADNSMYLMLQEKGRSGEKAQRHRMQQEAARSSDSCGLLHEGRRRSGVEDVGQLEVVARESADEAEVVASTLRTFEGWWRFLSMAAVRHARIARIARLWLGRSRDP